VHTINIIKADYQTLITCGMQCVCVSGVLLAVVIGVGLGLLIGALLFTVLLLKNK